MNEPFTILRETAAVLALASVDTDVIIRIERLTGEFDDDLGRWAFESLRYAPDGHEDPGFPLNWPQWRDAGILLAGPNFGCGSSREPAVVALRQMGFRCIVAESFGDIFFANCFQNGILPIRLSEPELRDLAAAAQGSNEPFVIDLPDQKIIAPGREPIEFMIDSRRKESLVTGLDDIGLTLRDADAIAEWVADDQVRRVWIWSPVRQEEIGGSVG